MGRTYDVSPDGQRFLMVKPVGPPRAGRRADHPHRRPRLVRGADAPRADELTGARQSFPEPRPRVLLLCCGPSSSSVCEKFSFSQYPRIPLRPPNDGLRSSRGSGCAAWVRDPALDFYPGTRGSRGPRRLCSLRSGHVCCDTFSVRSRVATHHSTVARSARERVDRALAARRLSGSRPRAPPRS